MGGKEKLLRRGFFVEINNLKIVCIGFRADTAERLGLPNEALDAVQFGTKRGQFSGKFRGVAGIDTHCDTLLKQLAPNSSKSSR